MYDLIIAYVENEEEEKHDTCTVMSNFYGIEYDSKGSSCDYLLDFL